MKKFIFVIFISLLSAKCIIANEITIIDLHNKSIDQLLKENLEKKNKTEDIVKNDDADAESEDELETNADDDVELESEDELEINTDDVELESEDETLNQKSSIEVNEILDNISINEVLEFSDMWSKITKEDIIFLLDNIIKVNSSVLKNELILILNSNNSIPKNFDKESFQKLIIDSLLSLGDSGKAYQVMKNFKDLTNIEYIIFYKKLELNYLLSTYYLSEACDFRSEIKELNIVTSDNFFLKVDIFCLLIQEKFDEANLLNSLLNENTSQSDEYFQYLFNKLLNIEQDIDDKKISIIESNVFLYSAMHRVGNIPLSDEFLLIDPVNLSIPIILSDATDIELRLKAAHLAYYNKLLSVESLAALYQIVDFSFDELNDPKEILSRLNSNIEIGMAYFYQLINIQLLPVTRLEAIIKFWEFAQKNSLELIAYELSLKNLNSIEPSNELASYGAEIAKAYTYNNDFLMAKKWLLFSENFLIDNEDFLYELNSSKLLFNLFNISDFENLTNVLYNNLEFMNENLINKSSSSYISKNEILYLIFSILNNDIKNPFEIERKINETRLMPSAYIINKIIDAIINRNHPELLLSIIASINGKEWNQIHPEHLRLILIGLTQYKEGNILNNILLEILKQSKII